MAHTIEETRRLTVVLPLSDVERLRRLLQPEEGMNALLRRLIRERLEAEAPLLNP